MHYIALIAPTLAEIQLVIGLCGTPDVGAVFRREATSFIPADGADLDFVACDREADLTVLCELLTEKKIAWVPYEPYVPEGCC